MKHLLKSKTFRKVMNNYNYNFHKNNNNNLKFNLFLYKTNK